MEEIENHLAYLRKQVRMGEIRESVQAHRLPIIATKQECRKYAFDGITLAKQPQFPRYASKCVGLVENFMMFCIFDLSPSQGTKQKRLDLTWESIVCDDNTVDTKRTRLCFRAMDAATACKEMTGHSDESSMSNFKLKLSRLPHTLKACPAPLYHKDGGDYAIVKSDSPCPDFWSI